MSSTKSLAIAPEDDITYDFPEEPVHVELKPDAIEAARYIAQMVAELSAMAGEAKLDMLTYLLNMARVEAEMISRSEEPDPTDEPDDFEDDEDD